MNFRRKNRERLEITLTPMIDVVFLLLIFFMVTTSFKRATELRINLPEASARPQTEVTEMLTLTIDAEGVYYVNNHQVVNKKLSTLRKALIDTAGNTRNIPFIIHADAKTPHQSVISALDVASKAGFTQITFATVAP